MYRYYFSPILYSIPIVNPFPQSHTNIRFHAKSNSRLYYPKYAGWGKTMEYHYSPFFCTLYIKTAHTKQSIGIRRIVQVMRQWITRSPNTPIFEIAFPFSSIQISHMDIFKIYIYKRIFLKILASSIYGISKDPEQQTTSRIDDPLLTIDNPNCLLLSVPPDNFANPTSNKVSVCVCVVLSTRCANKCLTRTNLYYSNGVSCCAFNERIGYFSRQTYIFEYLC